MQQLEAYKKNTVADTPRKSESGVFGFSLASSGKKLSNRGNRSNSGIDLTAENDNAEIQELRKKVESSGEVISTLMQELEVARKKAGMSSNNIDGTVISQACYTIISSTICCRRRRDDGFTAAS
jgi:hypothetical protein